MISNTVLVLPPEIDDAGNLIQTASHRAIKTIEFWEENWRDIGRIVACGIEVANILRASKIPRWLLITDDQPRIPERSIIETARLAKERAWAVDESNPICIVSSKEQFRKAQPLAAIALMVSLDAIRNIASTE